MPMIIAEMWTLEKLARRPKTAGGAFIFTRGSASLRGFLNGQSEDLRFDHQQLFGGK
jgi:hypothetical protein